MNFFSNLASINRGIKALGIALIMTMTSHVAMAKEQVNVSLFSWPGYGFWFIAQEKNLVPELDLNITIIEDPYESFALMSSGQLDATSSTAEYGPIAVDSDTPIKLVAYTNPGYGSDKIIVAPGIESPQDLIGKKIAVMEGGLSQIFVGVWLEKNGISIDQVEFVNVIMDEAVGAMIGGGVSAGEFWEPFGASVLKNMPGSTIAVNSSSPEWVQDALLCDSMYMSDKFLNDRPKAAALTMEAYFAAVEWWKKHPAEGNAIIAKALKFPVSDVESVIGTDGKPYKGGIMVFDKTQASQFMGLIPGELPLGIKNGGNVNHWNITSKWWEKFGLVKNTYDWTKGVDTAPLKTALESK